MPGLKASCTDQEVRVFTAEPRRSGDRRGEKINEKVKTWELTRSGTSQVESAEL